MARWNQYTARELKPRGWLRRQLELQAQGLAGNLDKVWPDVRDSAWVGGDREGWERVPYWLDGFLPLAYLLEDPDMIARAQRYIEKILASQQEDGWICPCEKEARATYDTWAVQLICKVLTVYYDCSSDERIPQVLYRALKNYYELLKSGEIELFGWGKFRWFEGCIAISFVYERYPEPWLPELARILRDQGADYEEFTDLWERPLNRWRFDTHIVNIAMMLKNEAVSCDLLGERYTDRAEKLHRILDKFNGTVYGSYTGDECLSGLSPIQGTELCAIVEQMYSCQILYAYTGKAVWADRLEKLAYNALPAAISEDMWTHQYDQMSNQIACQKFPGKAIFRTNGEESHLFGLEPNYGCCTANFGQGWPKFVLSSFMHRGDTVISAIPVPSELRCDGIHIRLNTDYPFRQELRYTVEAERSFAFKVRIPGWAKEVRVNGVEAKTGEQNFWICPGRTEIHISFAAQPDYLKRPQGLWAVEYGPLLFSVPVEHEKKALEYTRDGVERKAPYCDYELIPTSPWGYAYVRDPLTVTTCEVGNIPFSQTGPPVTVEATVRYIDWGYEDGYDTVCAKNPQSKKPLSQPHRICLIPYGCAKLRMTELPIIK